MFYYRIAHSATHNKIHLGTEYALQLVKHLEISMVFSVAANGSKFDEKIHIVFLWSKIVSNCLTKRKKPLNAVLVAKS